MIRITLLFLAIQCLLVSGQAPPTPQVPLPLNMTSITDVLLQNPGANQTVWELTNYQITTTGDQLSTTYSPNGNGFINESMLILNNLPKYQVFYVWSGEQCSKGISIRRKAQTIAEQFNDILGNATYTGQKPLKSDPSVLADQWFLETFEFNSLTYQTLSFNITQPGQLLEYAAESTICFCAEGDHNCIQTQCNPCFDHFVTSCQAVERAVMKVMSYQSIAIPAFQVPDFCPA